MPHKFLSAEWLQALKDKLNTDPQYARVAKNWEGDIMFFVEPDSPDGAPIRLYLDLWHGACREAFVVENDEQIAQRKPAFILRANYPIFRRIISSELDPMQAMITRKLKVQGSMAYMLRNVPVVLDFVRCAQEVDTEYPEE